MESFFKIWLWINFAAWVASVLLLPVLSDAHYFILMLAAIASSVTELFCVLAWKWARRRNL